MNDQVSELLRDEAAGAGAPRIDVDAAMRTGDRRRRRRGVGAVVVTAVAVATLTTAGLALQRDGAETPPTAPQVAGDPRPDAALPPTSGPRPASWITAGAIHTPTSTYALGDVSAANYVQSDDGFVVTDADGAVWFVDGSGPRQVAGPDPARQRVVSGDSGSYVASSEAREDGGADLVAFDTSTGRLATRVDLGTDLENVVAVGRDRAWVVAGGDLLGVSLPDGDVTVVETGVSASQVRDVTGGVVVWSDAPGRGLLVARDRDADGPLVGRFGGDLSPDGTLILTGTDGDLAGQPVEVATGEPIDLDLPAGLDVITVLWLGADVVEVVGTDGPTLSIRTCSTADGSCRTVAEGIEGSFPLAGVTGP